MCSSDLGPHRTPSDPIGPARGSDGVRWGPVGSGGGPPRVPPPPPHHLEGVGGRGYDSHTSVHDTRQDRHPGDGKRTPGRHPRGPIGGSGGGPKPPYPEKTRFLGTKLGFFRDFSRFLEPWAPRQSEGPVGPLQRSGGGPKGPKASPSESRPTCAGTGRCDQMSCPCKNRQHSERTGNGEKED